MKLKNIYFYLFLYTSSLMITTKPENQLLEGMKFAAGTVVMSLGVQALIKILSSLGEIYSQKEKINSKKSQSLNNVIQDIFKKVSIPKNNKEQIEDFVKSLYIKFIKRRNIPLQKGMLLYGPPGTGKTLLAKTIAETLGIPFSIFSAAELFNAYYIGKSAQNIRDAFQALQNQGGGILVIEELHKVNRNLSSPGDIALSQDFTAAINEFLGYLDGALYNSKKPVIVIATTNVDPSMMDDALIRPGRIEVHIEMQPANSTELVTQLILNSLEKHKAYFNEDFSKNEIFNIIEGKSLQNFSGAKINSIIEYIIRKATLTQIDHEESNKTPAKKTSKKQDIRIYISKENFLNNLKSFFESKESEPQTEKIDVRQEANSLAHHDPNVVSQVDFPIGDELSVNVKLNKKNPNSKNQKFTSKKKAWRNRQHL